MFGTHSRSRPFQPFFCRSRCSAAAGRLASVAAAARRRGHWCDASCNIILFLLRRFSSSSCSCCFSCFYDLSILLKCWLLVQMLPWADHGDERGTENYMYNVNATGSETR